MTKKNTLLLLLATGTGWLALTSYSSGPGSGGLGDLSGSGCGGSGCHANNSTSTVVQSIVLVDVSAGTPTPAGQYIPGRQYAVSVLGSLNPANSSLTHFGFQTTARNGSNATVGSINLSSTSNLQTYTANGRTGVEHSAKIAKNAGGFFTATWQWTAPAAGTGPVTFHTVINAVNNNGAVTGDQPNTGTTVFTEGTTAVKDVQRAKLLTIHPNPAKDHISIGAQTWPRGEYGITIVNTTGSVVLQQSARRTGSTESFDVVLPNLATGLYGIRVQGEGLVQSAPLFVR